MKIPPSLLLLPLSCSWDLEEMPLGLSFSIFSYVCLKMPLLEVPGMWPLQLEKEKLPVGCCPLQCE